jgi:histidinol-phosphatase (PHP family)
MNNQKRVDLHNHTTLCNHATGTTEEYIKKAIELKIDIFGFSEHAPMHFDEQYRLKLEDKEFYENDVLRLKEKYKNDIEILLGYEVDYLKGDYILPEVINSKVDYLIGSVHFINDGWGFDNPEFIGQYKNKNIDTIWQDYFEAITNMAKSNMFNIVGHLDLIKVFKFLPKKDIKIIALQALKQIKKSNMVVEINSAGYRKPIGEQYPSRELLELCYELDIPITFSSDAHKVDQVGLNYSKSISLAKQIGYTKCTYFQQKEKIETFF